jgi:hypothetical protein
LKRFSQPCFLNCMFFWKCKVLITLERNIW